MLDNLDKNIESIMNSCDSMTKLNELNSQLEQVSEKAKQSEKLLDEAKKDTGKS